MTGWVDPATAAMLATVRLCVLFSVFWPWQLHRRVCHAQPGAQVRSISWKVRVSRAVTPKRRIHNARDAAHAQLH
jgi:hypothetical protein